MTLPSEQQSLLNPSLAPSPMPQASAPCNAPVRPPIPEGYVNLMGFVDQSEVNGPGRRAVIWVQGCDRHCPSCFNPQSWSFDINQLISVEALVANILATPGQDGITFSGGEPFAQATALAEVARRVKAQGLNTMSFTGFTLEQLRGAQAPPGSQALLAQLDILLDGPFVDGLKVQTPSSPVSSRNQRLHVFNPALVDCISWASDQLEIHILKDGSSIVTGYQGALR